ncbi:20884_t:CDS:2 [Rhizophagus irregularis]|nr:20884_t:CDS:2 [Rhizophagus irregularis]
MGTHWARVPQQIRHQWNNELDPSINYEPFTKDERKYIDHWVATNRKADATTTSHQFPMKDDVSHFAQPLLNDVDNIGNTFLPTIIEPNFFQLHAPQLPPNPEFGIYNNNRNSFTHIPAIQPKFQPYLPTIVMKPVF